MKTDTEKLNEIIGQLNNEVSELESKFSAQDKNFEVLNSDNIWQGDSEAACIIKYKELSSQYPDIIQSLRNYISSLNNITKAYDELENSTSEFIDNNL